MKKQALLLIFLFIGAVSLQAQITQTIRGQVADKESKFPLIGVTVELLNTGNTLGTSTDENGNYIIEDVPVGRRALRFTYIGYKERVVQNVIVNSGKEVILNVELEESVETIGEVVVSATQNGEALNEMATLSVRQFSVAETDRYAGSRGDPARMASSYAGVQSNNDANNDIVVRGNSVFTLLWKFEGLNIPNPNHFKSPGWQGGAVTVLNNKYLSNSDFYTGAFPAEFGNALGGVFDLRMRNGNNKKHEYSFFLGALGTEIMGEGPINKEKGSSYLFNYRYSTLDLVLRLGIGIGTSAIPQYQDAAFRLNFPQKDGSNFAVWGVGGLYNADVKTSTDEAPDQELYATQDRDQRFFGNMGSLGMSYTKPIDKHTFFRANVGVGYNEYNRQDSLVFRRLVNDRFVVDSLRHFKGAKQGDFRINSSFFVNKKIGRQHVIKYGADADVFFANIFDTIRVVNQNSPAYNTYFSLYDADFDPSTLIQPYFQWKYRPNARLTFNAGLHAQYFSLSNSISYFEPRLGLKYQLPDNQSIKFGTGIHSQMQPMFVYYALDSTNNSVYKNRDLDFSKSFHVVAGYDRMLGKTMRLGVEAYYQYAFNSPIDTAANSFSLLSTLTYADNIVQRQLVNGTGTLGTMWNYGIDVTVEKFFSNNFYFLWTGSLFRSLYRGGDNIVRSSQFDSRFATNLLFSYEFVFKRSSLGLGIQSSYSGGRPYTPADVAASDARGDLVELDDERHTLRLADYFRLDTKLNYKIYRKGVTHEIGIDIVNVTNRQNIFGIRYVPDNDGDPSNNIQFEYQLGLLPIFFYRIDF